MAPPNARMMTSWIFMARSRAAAASTIVTSLIDDGCSATPGKSGHFTCSRERTDHVLPTAALSRVAGPRAFCYRLRVVGAQGARKSPGKAVRNRRDPVTVIGDETRESHWP